MAPLTLNSGVAKSRSQPALDSMKWVDRAVLSSQ